RLRATHTAWCAAGALTEDAIPASGAQPPSARGIRAAGSSRSARDRSHARIERLASRLQGETCCRDLVNLRQAAVDLLAPNAPATHLVGVTPANPASRPRSAKSGHHEPKTSRRVTESDLSDSDEASHHHHGEQELAHRFVHMRSRSSPIDAGSILTP